MPQSSLVSCADLGPLSPCQPSSNLGCWGKGDTEEPDITSEEQHGPQITNYIPFLYGSSRKETGQQNQLFTEELSLGKKEGEKSLFYVSCFSRD